MERLRWITPMPPACAMAMARPASVTVSMAAEMSGMPSSTVLVSLVRVSTWEGRTSDAAGTSSTSSKVSASRMGEEGSMAGHISVAPILQGSCHSWPLVRTAPGIRAAPGSLEWLQFRGGWSDVAARVFSIECAGRLGPLRANLRTNEAAISQYLPAAEEVAERPAAFLGTGASLAAQASYSISG